MARASVVLGEQLRQSRIVLAAAIIPSLAFIGVVVLLAVGLDIPPGHVMDDPLAEAGSHPLLGFGSNLGILMWAASAGACLVAYLSYRSSGAVARDEARAFFGWSTLLATALALDDTFQFHENLVRQMFGRGQTWILLGYVVLVALYVGRYRRVLASTQWIVLAAAGLAFAASLFVDVLPYAIALLPGGFVLDVEGPTEPFWLILEEGPKFLGIALWLAYYAHTAGSALQARPGFGRNEPG